MSTVLEHFQNDFNEGVTVDTPLTISSRPGMSGFEPITVTQKVHHHAHSSTRLLTYYVPDSPSTFIACLTIIRDIDRWRAHAQSIDIEAGFVGDQTAGAHQIVHSNRVYFYTEQPLNPDELATLTELIDEKKLFVTFRSQAYVRKKKELAIPLAFISHDSRNKETIARPLAHGLSSRLCPVWYDEFSLGVGDSLRESIEKGIKEAKKCILVLTPEFLTNPGWGKKEFDSIFTREMILNEKVVLPIWFNVTKQQVYEYSPALADRLALVWPSLEGKTDEEYKKEVELLISKLHTAIIS